MCHESPRADAPSAPRDAAARPSAGRLPRSTGTRPCDNPAVVEAASLPHARLGTHRPAVLPLAASLVGVAIALLALIADLHHLRVRAYFDEPEIGRLAVGQKIQIKWDAKPGRIWNGHIERTPVTVINLGTRSVGEVLVKIDDADGQLLPDTNVTATVTISSEPNSLGVPREALHSENGKTFVYKIVRGSLQKTFVVPGTINLTQVAILSGLEEGDVVATGSVSGQPLQDGISIKVVR